MDQNQRNISDYARSTLEGARSSIVCPLVSENNFKLKPNLFSSYSKFANLMGFKMKTLMPT